MASDLLPVSDNYFLASPDALEVIDLLIVSTDLTEVTLVSDDTY